MNEDQISTEPNEAGNLDLERRANEIVELPLARYLAEQEQRIAELQQQLDVALGERANKLLADLATFKDLEARMTTLEKPLKNIEEKWEEYLQKKQEDKS